MAKQIKREEIIQDNVFKSTKEDAKELLEVMQSLRDEFKEIAKITKNGLSKNKLNGVDDLKEFNKEQEKANKIIKENQKLEKEQIKLQKQLEQATDEQVKAKIRFQKATKKQKDELKDLIILEDEQAGTLEKLTARNRQLRREREKLNLQSDEGKTRLQEINAEIDKNNDFLVDNSDKLKKNKLQIGGYTDGIIDAIDQTGIISKLTAGFSKIQERLKDDLDNTNNSIGRTRKGIRGIGLALKASGIGLVLSALAGIGGALKNTQEGSDTLGKAFAQIGAVAGVVFQDIFKFLKQIPLRAKLVAAEIKNVFGTNQDEVDRLRNQLRKLNEEVGRPFENLNERIKDTIKSSGELFEQQQKFIRQTAILSEEIARLSKLEEERQSQADDTTQTLNDQQKASEDALKLAEKRLELELRLAQLNKDNLDAEVENFKRNNQNAKLSTDLLERQSESAVALIEKQKELSLARLNSARQQREIQRDVFERELDFAIDAFDVQKTVNERRIADERINLEERKRILAETERLAQQSFNNQIELAENYTGRQLELAELVKISDEEEIRRRLKLAEFDDVTAGRLLEIIKERKLALQDLADANRDLTEAEEERAELEADIADQTVALEKGTNKSIEQLQKEREKNEIELLRRRLERAEKGSLEELRLQQQLNDALLKEQQRLNDEKADADAKAKEKREEEIRENVELFTNSVDRIIERIEQRKDAEIKAIEDTLNKRSESISVQEQRAANGLSNTLAFEKEQLAKAEREKQRLEEQRVRREKVTAYWNLVSSAADTATTKEEFNNAAFKALAQIAIGEAIAGAFATGVENFQGAGTGTSDSNLIRFSHGESVITAKGTAKHKGLATAQNEGAVSSWVANTPSVLHAAISEAGYGSLSMNYGSGALSSEQVGALIGKLDKVEKAIKSKPVPSLDFDGMDRVVTRKVENGMTQVTRKMTRKPRI